MVKYRHPIPHLDDIFDQIYDSKIFSKIDLKSCYHHIHITLKINGELLLQRNIEFTSG